MSATHDLQDVATGGPLHTIVHHDRRAQNVDELRALLESHQDELRSLSLGLANQREQIKRMRRDLSSAETPERKLKALATAIDQILSKDEEWDMLEQYLSSESLDLSKKLTQKCPGITRTELKVCQLLRMGWSTKAIARFMATSPQTVSKHRSAIRAKLRIPKEVSMQTFLLEY